ncbi:adenylate/guanylate cyclase domain-containing protein [Candidatus Villigracilis affinis]|uniref:adenylate/guanylate cyclase domain-containing protein n=1 Tax=Candidatus Villigracilis affinis TaxID=3140682 RepID=UPI002A192CE7|nr:adenylate/guanylate cyclase domain-containing protein [Anaerolineales bacterium]
MNELPSGTVTFLFTDIEGSTKHWEQHPEAMKSALAKHDSILREAIESNHGHVIKTTGDGVHAMFGTAIDGVNAAIDAQRELARMKDEGGRMNEDLDSLFIIHPSSLSLKVRMGLHTGEAELRDGDYYGGTLNRAARIMSAGHGGQILISETTAQVAREHFASDVSLLDLGEHHLKGLTRAERIFQLVVPDLQKEFPALMSIATATNNLPAQLTSFIGREKEIREAKEKLLSAKLLTLIGPGGTGKTRLSIQLGMEVLPNFTDGVWFIELAPLADPALILQTIASVLNVRAQMGVSLKDIVIDYLRAKNLLLIFDNCEHLVEASAQLADEFLHHAPNLKIIASSREALGIGGETVYRVPSLSLPNQAQASRETLAGFESIQLFVDRARAANPKFDLTEKNASAVAQICRRLDGIPLALELAAARVTVFSAEQIATRLDDRFKLLTGGSRTALPRQQTLRALIDWSYDMLSEDERALLRRLSVFAGGWVFEAAESICPDLDVLDLLTQLVNKSLVTMDDEGDEPRYRLLETVRQYARDKLMEAGEAEQMRNRHLDYFVQLTESAEQALIGYAALSWINRLEAESDNLRAAFEWGMETNVVTVLTMTHALQYFWYRRGYETEGRRWAGQALEKIQNLPAVEGDLSTSAGARQRMLVTAKAWQAISFLATSQGDFLVANAASQKCQELARQLGDKRLLATELAFLVATKMMSGDTTYEDSVIEEIVNIARESNDPFALSVSHGVVGLNMLWKSQDARIANEHVAKGLALLKNTPHHFWQTMMLFGLGMEARFQGRFDEARERFVPLLAAFHEMGDQHRANMIHSECAHMQRLEGHHDKAESMYRETILEWQRLGHRAAVANQLECFAFIAKVNEQPERVIKLLGAAERLREIIQIDMSPMERVEYEREAGELRARMSEKEFNIQWLEGRAMTMEQAIAYALEIFV